jgi:hypothetical protein
VQRADNLNRFARASVSRRAILNKKKEKRKKRKGKKKEKPK